MEDLYSIRNDDKSSLQSKQPHDCWPSFVSVVPHRCIREFTFIISVQVVIQTTWSSILNPLLMLSQCPPSSDWYLDSWGRTSHCLSHSIFILDLTFCNRIVNRLFSKLPQRLQRGMRHLKPIIDSRREEQEKIGNGYEKPVGFLTSLTTSHCSTLDDFY